MRMPGAPDMRLGIRSAPFGHAGHAQPPFVEAALVGIIPLQHRARFGMDDNRDAQRFGHCVHGDIVMGGADAAGGEQVVVGFAKGIYRLCDAGDHIGHHAHFSEADPLHLQPAGHLGDVLVMRTAGEDLVPDHHERGGIDACRHQ